MNNKQKTHKSAARRFKITATGKVVHRSNGLKHLRKTKSKRQLRSLKQPKVIIGVFAKKIKKMLGKA